MELQNWKDAYKELATRITTKITDVKWVDLWHNQVNFLSEELPFKAPAIFLAFRSLSTEDVGQKVQDGDMQIDFYVFYETFADTFKGSYNQDDALAFLQILEDVHKFFHGYNGVNFSEMRSVAIIDVDTGGAGNLYKKSFVCNIRDYSAMVKVEDVVALPSGTPLFTL